MKVFATIVTAMLMLLVPQISSAKKKHILPVPATMLSAKTIYVDNKTGDSRLSNSAYMELMKWGRFHLTDNPQKADVILRLSGGSYSKYAANSGDSYSRAYLVDVKSTSNDNFASNDLTQLALVEPKTGRVLWTEERKTKGTEARRRLLEGLRQAFERQEKEKNAS